MAELKAETVTNKIFKFYIMKQYIIVGSNNFWYDAFSAETDKEAVEHLNTVKQGMKDGDYENNDSESLYLYEAKKIAESEV